MATGHLKIDLDALANNWRALDHKTEVETAAVIKADAYGLGIDPVARVLQSAGVRTFFVATCEEGVALRRIVGNTPEINVFSGHMKGDTDVIRSFDLTPMINSIDQLVRHMETLKGHPFGVQLDTGMNRLGMERAEWAAVAEIALSQHPTLIMSHLACADEPDHPMNAQQLAEFKDLTDGITVPRSLSATGGILLGPEFHFDMTRPGVGLYGGMPFADAEAVVELNVPIIQSRVVEAGETVGYGNTWTAPSDRRVATIAAGYADGLFRSLKDLSLYAGPIACPIIGRVSMDMIAVDVTQAPESTTEIQVIGTNTVDNLADAAGTIGYEILTSLGARYKRNYVTP